jgi:hypothetical protein
MVKPPSIPHDLPPYYPVSLLPAESASRLRADFPTGPAPHSADPSAGAGPAGVRTHVIREVVIFEVTCPLGDVVEDLDRAVELALAEGPRGVVCDLLGMPEGAQAGAVELLASVGRHVRDWPGIPVAVDCPDSRVREALVAHPLGRYLIVTASILPALRAVLTTTVPVIQRRQLAPHPTAARASRDFITHTLLDWRLGGLILPARLVVSELVASSTVHAGTDIDVSVAWNRQALRVTVRDRGLGQPRRGHSPLNLHGRGLTVVAGLSRVFGVLPTGDGGKVVWAVFDAPQQRLPSGEAPVWTRAIWFLESRLAVWRLALRRPRR